MDGFSEKGLEGYYHHPSNKHKIAYFRTRKPEFCKMSGSFKMNFDGRISLPSVKNFILEDVVTKEEVLMFGKNGEDVFNMDISYPLSPFIAMCIIAPYFQSKIFWLVWRYQFQIFSIVFFFIFTFSVLNLKSCSCGSIGGLAFKSFFSDNFSSLTIVSYFI